jgi:transcriptional regulator with XRE-family HTH domain
VAKKPVNRLRVLRAERGLRQRDLARRIGLSQGTYSLIESGDRPPTDEDRAALARVLKVEDEALGFGELPAGQRT